jgi:hypothetical protein
MMASMKPGHLDILSTFAVPDDNFTDLAVVIEEFILLHEYGHLRLGHLDCTKPSMPLDPGKIELPRTQNEELEADAYAVDCLLSHYPEEKVAIACGSLMHFFGLCEVLALLFVSSRQAGTHLAMMQSHPSGYARWERIKERTNVATRDDLSNELDDIFTDMVPTIGVIVLHEKLIALAERRRTGLAEIGDRLEPA